MPNAVATRKPHLKMTQVSISKPTGGVLPISASATQKNASTPSKSSAKPPTPRLKLLVRRLPPGLTQVEFQSALGEEWKLGAGKVDWFQYKEGKVSKEYVVLPISSLIMLTCYDSQSCKAIPAIACLSSCRFRAIYWSPSRESRSNLVLRFP